MTEPLTPQQLERLLPTLAHLAEMVKKTDSLPRRALQLLLMGSGLQEEWAVDELDRWARILTEAKEASDLIERELAQRTLMLRGIPEAAAMLAVSIVAGAGREQPSPLPQRLTASVERLDLGTLLPGQGATAEFEVQGGPGQIVAESDQVRVTPQQFGPGTTHIRIEVRPMQSGMLWTKLRLVTAGETLDVPVVAQWAVSSPSTSSTPLPNPFPASSLAPSGQSLGTPLLPTVNSLTPPSTKVGWSFWIEWVLVNTAIGLAFPLIDMHDIGPLMFWGILGSAQWLVLREHIRNAVWWVAASVVASVPQYFDDFAYLDWWAYYAVLGVCLGIRVC